MLIICEMFLGCSSLTSLNLSNFNTNNVKEMSKMFSGCSSLTSLNTKDERILKELKKIFDFFEISFLIFSCFFLNFIINTPQIIIQIRKYKKYILMIII